MSSLHGQRQNDTKAFLFRLTLTLLGLFYGSPFFGQVDEVAQALRECNCSEVLSDLELFFPLPGENFFMNREGSVVQLRPSGGDARISYSMMDERYWRHVSKKGYSSIGYFKRIKYNKLFLVLRSRRIKWIQCHMVGFWLFFNQNNQLQYLIEFEENSRPIQCWGATKQRH